MNEFTNPPINIEEEVTKAVRLIWEKVYDRPEDLISHLMQLIRDNSDNGARHKDQLERLLFKYDEIMEYGRKVTSGHRQYKRSLQDLKNEFGKKVSALLQLGYNIDRFKQQNAQQRKLL